MSRYSLRPLAENADLFEVALGWDPGLGTYFVIVFGTPDHEREPDIRLWRGTSPHEFGTPAEIIALAALYAEIPDGLARRLEIDRLRAPHNPDRPIARLLDELLACARGVPDISRSGAPEFITRTTPMSNCYTNCCFVLTVTSAEAALLREAIALAEFLETAVEEDAIVERWLGLSEAFRTLFAPTGGEVVSGFLAIFPDADYATFGTSFSLEEHEDGSVRVFARAEQFEPDAVAELLHRTVTQSLPVCVTWSYHSDRHQPDAFGGGGFMIDAAGVHWIGTSMVHDRARFSPKLVIAMRDAEEGLLFWNESDGFGSLEAAQVYTEEQARGVDLPIADDQPEWLALPASLVA